MNLTTRFQSDPQDPTSKLVQSLPCVGDYPVIGQYILCSQLGAGGAGAVFMGYHVKLQRPVAIKILNPAIVKMSDKAIARFTREAILSSQIRSNHIIPVTDAGTVPGSDIHYIIMDLVDGENAEDRVMRKGGQLSVSEALTIIRDASRGLTDAHRQEVIHRDLKPANIMISSAGEVRLADLGIATSFDRPNLKLTQSDEFLGTPQYMSPEQIRGEPLDGRTDVYSMGVTLHHLLCGAHPFHATSAYSVMQRVETESLPDIRELREDVPASVAGLITAATERNREERIPSAEALVARLEVLLRKQGPVALADPEAGGENRSRYVELTSEQLQALLPQVEKIARQSGAGSGKKGMVVALVVAVTILVAGLVITTLLAEPPIDRQVRAAMSQVDHAAVAEGLSNALTSTELNAPAREALVREVATWVTENWESPSAYLGDGQEHAVRVVTLLAEEQSEPFEQWVLASLDSLLAARDWPGVGGLLDRLEQWGAMQAQLRDRVGARVARPFEQQVRNPDESRIGSEGQAVLARLAGLGSERCQRLVKLRALSDKPELSAIEMREWFTLARDAGLLVFTLDSLLAATERTLVATPESQRELLPVIAELAEQSPEFEAKAVDRVVNYARQALSIGDWSGVLGSINVLRSLPSSDPAMVGELERSAMQAVATSAKLNENGTIDFPSEDPGPLLETLVERGVPGAVRWLIEARVTWNNEDRMVWRDGVTVQQKDQFPDLMRRAGTEFVPADLLRIIFLRAEASHWRLLPLLDDERTRTTLTSLMDGIEFGSADCSSRYLSLCALLGVEAMQAGVRSVDREPPSWEQLRAALEPASAAGANAFGRARARCWLGYGSLTYDPDAELNNLSKVRASLDTMLLAAEAGYGFALKPIDTILTALDPVFTPAILTENQQQRLNALGG